MVDLTRRANFVPGRNEVSDTRTTGECYWVGGTVSGLLIRAMSRVSYWAGSQSDSSPTVAWGRFV